MNLNVLMVEKNMNVHKIPSRTKLLNKNKMILNTSSKIFKSYIILLFLFQLSFNSEMFANKRKDFPVTAFGAVADGKTLMLEFLDILSKT